MTRLAGIIVFAALLILAAGCSNGPRRASVSGSVLVDKEPLAEGSISFHPTDGTEGPEAGGIIKDGKYDIPASQGPVVGMNKVVIRGFRKSDKKITDPFKKEQVFEMVLAVGPEFNDQSTLKRPIEAGSNKLDFELPGLKK